MTPRSLGLIGGDAVSEHRIQLPVDSAVDAVDTRRSGARPPPAGLYLTRCCRGASTPPKALGGRTPLRWRLKGDAKRCGDAVSAAVP